MIMIKEKGNEKCKGERTIKKVGGKKKKEKRKEEIRIKLKD